MKYKTYCRRMEKNKAIIRVAKHLLSRINYVLKNKKEYVTAVVAQDKDRFFYAYAEMHLYKIAIEKSTAI